LRCLSVLGRHAATSPFYLNSRHDKNRATIFSGDKSHQPMSGKHRNAIHQMAHNLGMTIPLTASDERSIEQNPPSTVSRQVVAMQLFCDGR